jgi:hypothetical protein
MDYKIGSTTALLVTLMAHPGATKAWSTDAHPGTKESHPGALEAHPAAMESQTGAMTTHPVATEAHPTALRETRSNHSSPCGHGGSP